MVTPAFEAYVLISCGVVLLFVLVFLQCIRLRACCNRHRECRGSQQRRRQRRQGVPRRRAGTYFPAGCVNNTPGHTRFILLIRRLGTFAPYRTLENDIPVPPPYDEENVPPPTYEQAVSSNPSNSLSSPEMPQEGAEASTRSRATAQVILACHDDDVELIDSSADPKVEGDEGCVNSESGQTVVQELPPPYTRL